MEEIREKLKIPGKSKSLQFPRRWWKRERILTSKEYAEDVFKMIDATGQYSVFIPQDQNSAEMLQQIKEG